jgi:hypothetical protein
MNLYSNNQLEQSQQKYPRYLPAQESGGVIARALGPEYLKQKSSVKQKPRAIAWN